MNTGEHLPRLGEALDLIRLLEGHCRDLRSTNQIAVEAEIEEIEAIINQIRNELNSIIRGHS